MGVIDAVFFIPELDAVAAEIFHRLSDVNEMFEELACNVFVRGIFFGKFESDGEHIEAIHTHPAGAVGLLEMAASRERRRAIEDADVIEAQEPALKDVRAFRIFAIDPPSEIE